MVYFRVQTFLKDGACNKDCTSMEMQEMTHGPHTSTKTLIVKAEPRTLNPPTKKHVYQTPNQGGAFTAVKA